MRGDFEIWFMSVLSKKFGTQKLKEGRCNKVKKEIARKNKFSGRVEQSIQHAKIIQRDDEAGKEKDSEWWML